MHSEQVCKYCQRSFKSHAKLDNHIERKHADEAGKEAVESVMEADLKFIRKHREGDSMYMDRNENQTGIQTNT